MCFENVQLTYILTIVKRQTRYEKISHILMNNLHENMRYLLYFLPMINNSCLKNIEQNHYFFNICIIFSKNVSI